MNELPNSPDFDTLVNDTITKKVDTSIQYGSTLYTTYVSITKTYS